MSAHMVSRSFETGVSCRDHLHENQGLKQVVRGNHQGYLLKVDSIRSFGPTQDSPIQVLEYSIPKICISKHSPGAFAAY